MGKQYDAITDKQVEFIRAQKVFFVGTADREGRVNISPKGMDSLRVLGPGRVVWLNLTGSGNETAAHLRASTRITLMFCAFEGDPLILRLYGHARVLHSRDSEWDELSTWFPAFMGARQLIDVDIDLVQTSCGFGVPYMDFRGEREQLAHWSESKGVDGIRRYWRDKNRFSLDGKPTGIVED